MATAESSYQSTVSRSGMRFISARPSLTLFGTDGSGINGGGGGAAISATELGGSGGGGAGATGAAGAGQAGSAGGGVSVGMGGPAAAGALSLRQGHWKYIEPGQGPKVNQNTNTEMVNDPAGQLYNLADDLVEAKNLASEHPNGQKRCSRCFRSCASKVAAAHSPSEFGLTTAFGRYGGVPHAGARAHSAFTWSGRWFAPPTSFGFVCFINFRPYFPGQQTVRAKVVWLTQWRLLTISRD